MIRTSEQTGDLMGCLAKAQAKFGAAIKSSQNPAFRSKYADITSIIDATLEHLNAEGIVLTQHPFLEFKGEGDSREAFATVTTRLQWGEQWLESDLSIPAVQRDRFDAQSVGSAITYASRYAMQSILVVPREDDDANAATGRGTHEEAQAVGKKKIDALRASKAQETPSDGASLFYALQDSGLYAIAGDKELMKKLWPQFKKAWQQHAEAYMVNEEGLEQIRFQCEQGNIPLHVLKAPNA